MRKRFFAGVLGTLAAGLYAPAEVQAGGRGGPVRQVSSYRGYSTTSVRVQQTTANRPTPVRDFASNVAQSVSGGLAETKSRIQAAAGRMFHAGGGMGRGTHEGVGFSTRSPQEALAKCCYSNSGMTIVDQSVVRGANGWYATRIYSATGVVQSHRQNVQPVQYSAPAPIIIRPVQQPVPMPMAAPAPTPVRKPVATFVPLGTAEIVPCNGAYCHNR